MMAATASRILVVEDETDVANLVKHALERGGDATVEIVASGRGRPAVGRGRRRRTC